MIWKLWHWESQYNHIHPEHFHTLSLVIGMVYLLPVLCMTKVDLGQRFSIHSFSACTLRLHLTFLWYIWYAFVPYKEVSSIYPFIFSNLSDVQKNNERSGKHMQHLEVFLFFNLVHCSIHVIVTLQPFLNTLFPSNKPPPPPFCPSFLAMDPINEEDSKYLLTIQMRNQWQVVSKEKKKI